MNIDYHIKVYLLEEVLRQKKVYIAEVGLREYEALFDLVSTGYIKDWKTLKEHLGELSPHAESLSRLNWGPDGNWIPIK
jgi:hypothetical protein